MTIAKKITLTAKAGNQQALKELLVSMVEPSRHEPGCLTYELYQLEEQPHNFFLIETWRDEISLENHKHTPHFENFKAVSGDLIESKGSVSLNPLG
jgi:quinol monooxygenase YgiN